MISPFFKMVLSFFFLILISHQSFAQQVIPHLQQLKGGGTQLIVNGKPYLIFGGELGNSAASDLNYLKPAWHKIKVMNLNTVLVPVYWDLIEKKEGQFDFSLVDGIIRDARKRNLRLILLWFGSWKNSVSTYVPGWVKKGQDQFPRAKDDNGNSLDILTPFSKNNLEADKQAFVKLMQHLKKFDRKEHTVIMVQVENEIGVIPSTRDYSPAANKAFHQPVPNELMSYLEKHKNNLAPILYKAWKKQGFKTSGSWQEVFGKESPANYALTDEIFMAWYYGKYVNSIAQAGKKAYPLPMYVNAALYRPHEQPGKDYGSGAPLPFLMDVWKAAAPFINILAPDIYFPDFKKWCDLYTRQGNPLFIPEHHFNDAAAADAFYTFGHYDGLGFSPFSIESTDHPRGEPLGKAYNILSQLSPLITKYRPQGKVEGVLLNRYDWFGHKYRHDSAIVKMGKYKFTFKHDYTLGWSPEAKNKKWPSAGAIIIQTGPNTFYIGGTGIVVAFAVRDSDEKKAGILRDDEGSFVDGKWQPGRHLNGDQTNQGRFLRIPVHDFDIQRLVLYQYN